ncbi:hypothetical protein Acr_12g0002700 [Actinidia rufa]|uniref:Uncharacterized protein n=1 Tax=Actinidia rufa TaxID=165716 RepID=A0A7J0FHS8_9ERIC|nr:hypothetical protein Acr_12g0002700 [Actinidia rufa]
MSTSQKIRDLGACFDAINTGASAPITVDTLIRQTEPPFTKMILRVRVSSKFKLLIQLGIYEGKMDPMDHLDSYKSLMSLYGCSDEETESLKDYVMQFNQAILEVEDPSDKVVIMAMMERLRPGSLFDSLSKNIFETLSALQSKADKYIAAEELAKAKHRRRGKDDHNRKEPDTRRSDYREETKSKRTDRDSKRTNERRPHTPPRRSELILPPFNVTMAQVLTEIKHEEIVKRPEKIKTGLGKETRTSIVIHGEFGSGGRSSSSRKRHARNANGRANEEVYNLSSSAVDILPPITFNNDDLRGLNFPHNDALVVLAVIVNFNIQRILVDNGSSADILFISAMKIGLDKLHPFHTTLVGFGGNTTHPLGWIKLSVTLGTKPHQTTVWQDFIMVDCPLPYNAILGRPTLGGIRAITSTYHLKMKFPTTTGVREVRGDQKISRQCFISAMKAEPSPRSSSQ